MNKTMRILLALMLAGFAGLLPQSGQAQRTTTIGTWTPYLSYEYVKQIIRDGDDFYCNTRGGFFHWDTQTDVFSTYSPIDGLSDVDASAMYLDTLTGYIFMGYENGAINYFKKPFGEVNYMTDIKRTDLFTSKRINLFKSRGDLLYIATDFGVVIFDIAKGETKSSVTKVGDLPTGTAVNDMEIVEDTLYLCMGTGGLYFTHLNQPNITVPTVWTKADGTRGLTEGAADQITHLDETVYVMVGDTSYTKRKGGNWTVGPLPHRNYDFFEANDSLLYCGYEQYIRVHKDGNPQYLIVNDHGAAFAYIDSNYTLYSDKVTTLRMVSEDLDTFAEIGPDGPQQNIITQIAVGNGEIFVAPQGQAGGTSVPLDIATGFYYYHQDKGWHNFNVEDEISRDSIYEDIARLHYDSESRTCYFGSWGQGVIKFRNDSILRNYQSTNSGLSGSYTQGGGADTRVTGLDMDTDGNLWISAILADQNLNLLTAEGVWHQYNLPGAFPTDLIVDDWGNKWVINNGLGLTVFNENGTFDVTSDDLIKNLGTTAGAGGLPSGNVNALAKDRNGHIWVGTLEGIAVFANPSRVFQSNFSDASCPVIDGFCLLRDQRVTAIEVDGANRKWIGTENGVYVVNPQGNRLIEHITVDNSPLFSNEIRDIEIDPVTGEIFFATSKGLVSLMGESTEGKETSDDLYVFPNPIYTDYDGSVAISCSVTDAEVRITTASGMLVRELDALGGQAVWDGRDAAGNRLTPGIYLAMVADREGKGAGIAKFAVVARQP